MAVFGEQARANRTGPRKQKLHVCCGHCGRHLRCATAALQAELGIFAVSSPGQVNTPSCCDPVYVTARQCLCRRAAPTAPTQGRPQQQVPANTSDEERAEGVCVAARPEAAGAGRQQQQQQQVAAAMYLSCALANGDIYGCAAVWTHAHIVLSLLRRVCSLGRLYVV